ncbi:mechanosensitive ion channel family protein [Saccharophagus sp. K07]|nr:mechanosensitive ion channel domain-containing protein [Saccharophagus sp. K07]MBC6905892.1 mechanosensitive ion channel family protein [Saccharophagus sp. K07]
MFDQIPHLIVIYSIKILLALAVFFIGRWIAKRVSILLGRTLTFRGVDSAVSAFFRQISYYGLLIVVIVAALGQLGVQTASFVAVIGAAGLAVGLALQGSLSNFAAGVLLILFRPFRAGDYIEAAGAAGSVREISIFSTTLITADNKTVTIPNGGILSGNVVNHSIQPQRRIDLDVIVGYSANVARVKEELSAVVQNESRVLKDKEIAIGVTGFVETGIKFVVRVWVKSSDLGDTQFALLENIKNRFDAAGIEMPYRQVDVQLSKIPPIRQES